MVKQKSCMRRDNTEVRGTMYDKGDGSIRRTRRHGQLGKLSRKFLTKFLVKTL